MQLLVSLMQQTDTVTNCLCFLYTSQNKCALKLGVREKMRKRRGKQGQRASEGSDVWWLLSQAQGKLQHVVK